MSRLTQTLGNISSVRIQIKDAFFEVNNVNTEKSDELITRINTEILDLQNKITKICQEYKR